MYVNIGGDFSVRTETLVETAVNLIQQDHLITYAFVHFELKKGDSTL